MTPLIEALKNWRTAKEKRDDITFTNAEWSLDPKFIGESINSDTVRSIGDYVDDKLTEYSQQNNINPVRNRLQGILRGNTAETDIDDHVASRRRISDSFVRRLWQEQQITDNLRSNYNITNPERITHDGRNIHQVIRFCPPTKSLTPSAYVSNYTLDYQEMKIKARIIIAPKDKIISPSDWFNYCTNDEALTLKDLVKKTVWENMKPGIICRPDPFKNVSPSEGCALETLREMVTEGAFKKYLKHGFILVQSPSGLIYQIFKNSWHIKVWDKGNLIEEICVRIKSDKIPSTDNVIAFKAIIETDENEIHQMGNVYNMRKKAA